MGTKLCCKKGEEVEDTQEETRPEFKPVLKEMRKSTRILGGFAEKLDKFLSDKSAPAGVSLDEVKIEEQEEPKTEDVAPEVTEEQSKPEFVTRDEFEARMTRVEELEVSLREFVDKPIKIEINLKEPERSRASSSKRSSRSSK